MFEVEGAKKMRREIAVCGGAPVVIYSIYLTKFCTLGRIPRGHLTLLWCLGQI